MSAYITRGYITTNGRTKGKTNKQNKWRQAMQATRHNIPGVFGVLWVLLQFFVDSGKHFSNIFHVAFAYVLFGWAFFTRRLGPTEPTHSETDKPEHFLSIFHAFSFAPWFFTFSLSVPPPLHGRCDVHLFARTPYEWVLRGEGGRGGKIENCAGISRKICIPWLA